MGKFTLKYIMCDDVHKIWAYTVEDRESKRLVDVNPSSFISGQYKAVDNYQETAKGPRFPGVPMIMCGKDYTKFTGSLKKGFNDFETFCLKNGLQNLLDEYDTSKNPKPVDGISSRAIDRVWWKCKTCGHEWESIIKNRTGTAKAGCPMCKFKEGKYQTTFTGENDLETWCKQHDRMDIISEYSPNNEITPNKVARGNTTIKLEWVCHVCHKTYTSTAANRVNSQGCPHCRPVGTSLPELALYYLMSEMFDDTQHKARCLSNNRMELDIFIPSLKAGIEYQGSHWHSSDTVKKRDSDKQELAKAAGIHLIYIAEDHSCKEPYIENQHIICPPGGNKFEKTSALLVGLINGLFNLNLEPNEEATSRSMAQAKVAINHRIVENSVAEVAPYVADRWDYERNGGLTPDKVTRGCKYKAWFICKMGHRYYSFIRKQVKEKQGCPYCTNVKILAGFNDLSTKRPDVMAFWDFEKNNAIGVDPTKIACGTSVLAHFKCPTCGLESTRMVRDYCIVHKEGAPIVCNRCHGDPNFTVNENIKPYGASPLTELNKRAIQLGATASPGSFAARFPLALRFVDPKKAGEHNLMESMPSGDEIISTICPVCHKRKRMRVGDMVSTGKKCFNCKTLVNAERLEETCLNEYPDIYSVWANANIYLPEYIGLQSGLTVKFICPACQNSWDEPVVSYTTKRLRCPICREYIKTLPSGR